jgi:hypothetical protein
MTGCYELQARKNVGGILDVLNLIHDTPSLPVPSEPRDILSSPSSASHYLYLYYNLIVGGKMEIPLYGCSLRSVDVCLHPYQANRDQVRSS